ncbi:hypothetical protein XENOCAPTIV_030790 [Xenoophorus captivus]|uniref:Uncharacterized protein n=1 Tax=Xenoophorus captivus TaxID=1517983 RepID=A0ABV0QNV8_9TELE
MPVCPVGLSMTLPFSLSCFFVSFLIIIQYIFMFIQHSHTCPSATKHDKHCITSLDTPPSPLKMVAAALFCGEASLHQRHGNLSDLMKKLINTGESWKTSC